VRAVVIATGESADMRSLTERYPTPLLPLLDRPFIQHVVESLVDLGVTEFDFILSHLPERVERLLGDGKRWGSTFAFHLSRDASHPYQFLDIIGLRGDERPIILAHADRLPEIQIVQRALSSCPSAVTVFCWQQSSEGGEIPSALAAMGESNLRRWTGWACLPARLLDGLPDGLSELALGAHLRALAQHDGVLCEVPPPLSVQGYDELLAAQWAVLNKSFRGLRRGGTETDEGIWLSRNVSLHPSARLIPPVYIGENCRIGEGVQVGPHAVIGSDCVLDTRCTVLNAMVFPGSYVGEALELADSIADKNRLINVRVGASVSVIDDFILGSISDRHLRRWLGSLFSRGVAMTLLACTWPLLLITGLSLKVCRGRPVLHSAEVVRLPASAEEMTWQTFQLWSFCANVLHGEETELQGERNKGKAHRLLQHFLPALVNIAKGEVHFVGAPLRTSGEIKALPHDWQALYLHTKAGIVTEACVYHGLTPTADEQYSAEVFYSVRAGVRHDLRLMICYVGRILGIFPRHAQESGGRVKG
jgi:lipopolysaccharide/colanic/teichoic acid biosynthesis glycosyltransferase/acetyltransferase-like isoleucine patch superfamily enzyme